MPEPPRNLTEMTATATVHDVEMGFLPPSFAVPDLDHPGLLRAGERTGAPYGGETVEMHRCQATDLAAPGTEPPDLLEQGFDVVDLSSFDALQEVLAGVATAGLVTDEDTAAIRGALDGAVLSCSSGRTLKVLHLAGEGLFMRTGGPNRMALVPRHSNGANGHGAATSVHIDQDVYGTPLTQVMDGRAPELLRHDSPDGHNHDASLLLVNVWIPLRQITQPLVIADGRSVDRRRHQLRYGLPTESFLERNDDMAVNDIWTLLHDAGQRWSFRSEMDHRLAYVFNTLSAPHGAAVLVGEDLAERGYRVLDAAEAASSEGDVAALTASLVDVDLRPGGRHMTDALRRAVDEMATLIDEAAAHPSAVCGSAGREWRTRSAAARRAVVRTSIEMRVVVSLVD